MARELGHTEVYQFDSNLVDIARLQAVDHHVVELEITVHYSFGVQVRYGMHHLADNNLAFILGYLLLFVQVV